MFVVLVLTKTSSFLLRLVDMTSHSTSGPIAALAERLLLQWGGKRNPAEKPANNISSNLAGSELGRPVSQSTVGQYTYRHTALSLYLARLLRPIWKRKVLKVTNTIRGLVDSEISDFVLTAVQKDLYSLRAFLTSNIELFTPQPIVSSNPPGEKDQIEIENANAETKSLKAQLLLLTQCIEGIAFVLFLVDSKMSETVSKYVKVFNSFVYDIPLLVMILLLTSVHFRLFLVSPLSHSKPCWELPTRHC